MGKVFEIDMKKDKVINWYKKFENKSLSRYQTFSEALSRLWMSDPVILETGTVRQKDDYGAGYSTYIFGEYASLFGGKVISIDISPDNIKTSKECTEQFKDFITYVEGDSIKYLKEKTVMIDLLYLDSMDCPIEGDASDAQRHNFLEFLAAERCLHDESVVLIDDSGGFPNGGKARWTEIYLEARGWNPLIRSHQSLWVKGEK